MCFEVNNGTGGLEGVEKSFFWSNKVSGVRQQSQLIFGAPWYTYADTGSSICAEKASFRF